MLDKVLSAMKNSIKIFNGQSIKFRILSLYLSLIIFSLVVTNGFIYFATEKQLEENVNHITNETVKQINNNISSKFNLVIEQLVKIKYDTKFQSIVGANIKENSTAEEPENIIYINSLFKDIYEFDRNFELIDSIVIYLDDARKYYFIQDKNLSVKKELTSEDYKIYADKKKDYKWLNEHSDTIVKYVDNTKVVSVSTAIKVNNEIKALIIININENYLKKMIKDVNLYKNGYVMLISSDGQIASKEIDDNIKLSKVLLKKIVYASNENGTEEFKSKEGNLLVVYTTLKINGWKIVAVLKKSELMDKITKTKLLTIYLVIAIILLSMVISILIANGLTKPINKLASLMLEAQEGNFDIRFKTKYKDEIGIMADQFNRLLKNTKDLLYKVEEEQILKRKSELKTLQMQINPHFLYNTLDSIKFLAEQKSEMVKALGQFYRLSLSKGNYKITIEEEINHLKSYLTIQKIRYSTQFDYFVEVEENIFEYSIIKFILQPLVENSIYHGVKRSRNMGIITIKGKSENGNIIFTIHDNGVGIPLDKQEIIKENLYNNCLPKHSGIGIYNVHKRLNIEYGDPYGIDIDSVYGEYTKIKITFPLETVKD